MQDMWHSGRGQERERFWHKLVVKSKGRDHVEDLDLDGKIML
jgi:hypothetical protein